jgi:hypothetical protein
LVVGGAEMFENLGSSFWNLIGFNKNIPSSWIMDGYSPLFLYTMRISHISYWQPGICTWRGPRIGNPKSSSLFIICSRETNSEKGFSFVLL